MLLYINEKQITPTVLCNKFDFQPYLSTYVNDPLDNFKNDYNQSVTYGESLVTTKIYPVSSEKSPVLVQASVNEIEIGYTPGKINHPPVADFEYELDSKGNILLTNTSYDIDDDELKYRWTISDNVIFNSTDVKYQFQYAGAHTITLVASDYELSDSKTVYIIADGAGGYSEYVIVDFDVEQNGYVFTATDTSEPRNTTSYERTWYLDGTELDSKEQVISLTLADKQRHTLALKCETGRFSDTVEKYLYADVSAIISVKSIIINRGTTITLDGSNSYAMGDQVNSYEWDEVTD